MCKHYSLSQFLSMPFTLPLIGHLSHAWFHLIKPGWLQGENGGRKVGCGDFLLGDLSTQISCHNLRDCSGQSSRNCDLYVLIYLGSLYSVNLIHAVYILVLYQTVDCKRTSRWYIFPHFQLRDFIQPPPQHCLPVHPASWVSQFRLSRGSHQPRCQTIAIW